MIVSGYTTYSGDEDWDHTHTMAAQYGCLKEFQPEADSVKAYLERVTLYFEAVRALINLHGELFIITDSYVSMVSNP